MRRLTQFVNLPLRYHLAAGAIIRLLLISYGDYHDKVYDVPYTDVDYKVFTDAARHVINGNSPYKRHTYRYSPIIAYLMIPNITFTPEFGKILFSAFDILVTIALKILVGHQLGSADKEKASRISMYCSLFWLYNPLSICISTRGNADSVPCLFIVLSLLFLQTNVVKGLIKYCLAGAMLGVSIHLRLYPLVFSLPMYICLEDYNTNCGATVKECLLSFLPNKKQIILASSCTVTLILLTYGMYHLYGYEFLFETYIYHLFRKDTRHNFSVLFYYSYLTMDNIAFDIMKVIPQFFECIILFAISLTFGSEMRTLNFAVFCQAVVLVAYNSVMTSQYFIWFLSLLPLVVHSFKMKPANALVLTIIWCSAQVAWLFYAYLLEFKSREVFILLWLKGVVFFCANIFVLSQLIKSYTPGYGFGQIDYVGNKKKNK